MRPHSEDTDDFFQSEKLHRLVCAEYLFGGKKSGQVADEFFVRWRILEWVDFQDFNEIYHVLL